PKDGLQADRPVRGRGRGRAEGAQLRATAPSECGSGGDRGSGARGPSLASELGREEDSRLACRASAGGALAGREYDLRAARSPWPGGSAPVAPAGAAWRLAAGGVRGG